MSWLISSSMTGIRQHVDICKDQSTENTNPTETIHHNIPTWAAYNSRVLDPLEHLTRVAVPPLLPYPAHEWTT